MLPPMIDVNAYLIERFYAAFDARDGDAMAACYAPGAHFSDPVFPDLNGDEPGAMWRMLTSQARSCGSSWSSTRRRTIAGADAGGRTTCSRRPGAPWSTTCARRSASRTG